MRISNPATPVTRTVLAVVAGLFFLTLIACDKASSSYVMGTSSTVYGSGVTVEESRPVSGVRGITLAGTGTVYVRQGGAPSLIVRAEDNLMEHLETPVHGDTLVMRTQAGFDLQPTREIEYHLVVTNLRRVELRGAGGINASSITADHLVVVRSGVGNLDFTDLGVTSLQATLSGVGSARVDGVAQRQSVVLGGFGNYEAGGLQTAEADITIRSGGSATVRVSGRLDARIDGSGSVYYIGDPVVTRSGHGSGSVVPAAG